jgi:hypothetical protein
MIWEAGGLGARVLVTAANGVGQTPTREKHADAHGKQAEVRTKWPGRHDVDEEHSHPDQLPDASKVINGTKHGPSNAFYHGGRGGLGGCPLW